MEIGIVFLNVIVATSVLADCSIRNQVDFVGQVVYAPASVDG